MIIIFKGVLILENNITEQDKQLLDFYYKKKKQKKTVI